MTPRQLAEAHCANYQPGGWCLGAFYGDDGNILTPLHSLPECLLRKPVTQCPYFEEYVLPMKLEDRNRDTQERKRAEFAEGVRQYRLAVAPDVVRRCRQCRHDTGNKKRQFCDECRVKQRRASYKQSKRKHRGSKCPHSVDVSASMRWPANSPIGVAATTIPAGVQRQFQICPELAYV